MKTTDAGDTFRPKVIGFLCSWCAYAGADMAGASQLPVPSELQVVRLLCSGRLDPQFVLKAFREGADGVLVLACHPGDCHYREGNCQALQRHRLLLRILPGFGIDPQRCRLDYVSASEGHRFQEIVTEMVATVGVLGPLGHPDAR